MKFTTAVIVGLVLSVTAAVAQQNTMLRELYCGTFRWDGDQLDQRVIFDFMYPRQVADDFTLLEGVGLYITDEGRRHTRITIIMRLDNSSREFEIFERNPDNDGFVTDGSHAGRLTDNLRKIDATWTTNGTGEMGKLMLDTAACSRLVS